MTTDAVTKPAKTVAEPKIKCVQVNPETFDLICKALYNTSTEQQAQARDVSELRLAIVQIGATLNAMCVDLRTIAAAHSERPADIETLARRLADTDQVEMPMILRNAQGMR